MNRKQILSLAVAILAVAAAAVVPLLTKSDSTLNLIILLLLYITLASSWNILGGYTGQTNLGHAAFFGLGSLVTRLLWVADLPFVVCLAAGGLAAVVLGLLIGIPAFKLKGVYFAIGTLAMALMFNITVGNILPEMSYNPQISDYQLIPRYYLFLGLAVVTVAAGYLLVNSRRGLGMMAVREGEDAAESLGISALGHKLLALSVSALFAGLAGSAFAYYHVSYYLNMPFGPEWTFDPVMMAYIGGTGTIIGPVIGSIFYVGLKQLLVWNVGEYHLIIFGALFILIVLFLPGGLVEAWGKLRKLFLRRFGQKASVPGDAIRP